MNKQLLIAAVICVTVVAHLSAQNQTPPPADTFRIQNFPLKYWYKNKPISQPKAIEPILFSKNDAQIEQNWKRSKTLRTVGTVVQIAGLVVEGLGLVNVAQGKGDENNLLLKGIGISLGGVILQVIGTGPAKKSMRRYNSLHTGRITATVAPPIPTVFASVGDTLAVADNAAPAMATQQKMSNPPTGASSSRFWLGVGIGMGWSKQKISYEEAFASPLEHARSFSYSLQFGQKITDRMSWQTELNLTQHGYREVSNGKYQGVTTKALADLRAQYAEVPVLISYSIPTGIKSLEIDLLGGLCAGRLRAAKVVGKGKGENNDTKVSLRVSSALDLRDVESKDKWDTALQFGARAGYALGFGRFFAEARYHYGFLNLDRNAESFDEEEKLRRFNRTLSIRLGYQVPIGAQ